MSTTSIRKCGVCKLPGHNSRTCPTRLANPGRPSAPEAAPSIDTAAAPPAAPLHLKKPNLGLINIGARQVFVCLTPSQAESVIVKYQPEIQVSCVIPPHKFPISYAYSRSTHRKKTLEITTPTLIMSCGYGDVPGPRTYQRLIRPYTLWVIDTVRKSKIYGKAYLFANVYESGKICFGGLKPSSLRQAYSQYWTSSFNAELYRQTRTVTHVCQTRRHNFRYHTGHRCDPTKKAHTCACPRVTFHKHNRSIDGLSRGCGCTTVGRSKSCRGACSNSQTTTSHGCTCCRAIQEVQARALLTSATPLSQRKLNKLAIVENAEYPGCGCTYRHKRGCLCTSLRCDCECRCDCCTQSCGHGVCLCSCCKDECSCSCNCSAGIRFGSHLENYHAKIMPKQRWTDRTSLFCGTKFWAAPKAGFGVIMSNDKMLLRRIPRQFWRKDKNDQPLVIALANKNPEPEGGWTFESGGFTFQLSDENVMAK